MNGGSRWLNAVFFIIGCLVCFIATQFIYLDIDYKVNVIESLISTCTVVVGLYLGITINSKFNNKQHFISFIGPKLESILVIGSDIRSLIEPNTSIDSATINNKIHILNRGLAQLTKIFKTFKTDVNCINEIDVAIDEFEQKLSSSPVFSNIINYTTTKTELLTLLDKLDIKIVTAVNILHKQ